MKQLYALKEAVRRATHAVRSIRDVCAEAVRRARAYAPVRTHAPHLYIYSSVPIYGRMKHMRLN